MTLVSKGATLSASKSSLDRENGKLKRIASHRKVKVEWNGIETWVRISELQGALQRGARTC
jgi:pyrroloquinoline quinone (PQQ) biosynthesis protein C